MTTHDIIIVGAGLSGLSAAHFLSKKRPELDILLLEKAGRAGGAIQSLEIDGFLGEWGPHGFLDNIQESRELLDDLKLDHEIQKAPLKKFLRYICLNGQLQTIPQTPPKIISSDLLPLWAKLRMLADLWKKPLPHEQSIADWAAHRFGRSILPFADIVQTGQFAGDFDRLSIDAAMPGLRKLEKENGSVFRGAVKAQKNKVSSGMPSMVSFKKGMEQLIKKLAADKNLRLNSGVNGISKKEELWCVETKTGNYSAKNLVIGLHINRALPLLHSLAPAPEQSVPEAMVYNIVMGFKEDAKIPFGFGYLAPKSENRFALGTLFPTQMFPGRAPDGMQSLEVLIGGIRNPQHLTLSDEALVAAAYADISQLMPLPSKPSFTKVLRPEIGIPQLEIGHHRFQSYREKMETEFPGLYINGFGWEGIGANEMIKTAKSTAENLIKGRGGAKGATTVKGVYF
ncbi:MAG: protoporphyrinogen oxidase [SAR324 cluster bacterium]|nr:protoporphyrinogen oxidase [SAR324 cluster bacterium]